MRSRATPRRQTTLDASDWHLAEAQTQAQGEGLRRWWRAHIRGKRPEEVDDNQGTSNGPGLESTLAPNTLPCPKMGHHRVIDTAQGTALEAKVSVVEVQGWC